MLSLWQKLCHFIVNANTHPKTQTLGGYTYLASDANTTTHTLLTNPTTHYKASDNGVLPNNPNTWIPYSSTITKTIYDPCPYGYRVPIDGSWNGFPINKWAAYAITGGASWPTTGGDWWPATGHRYYGDAILYEVGNGGWYWSSSCHTSSVNYAFYLGFAYAGGASSSNSNIRSHGFPVRCIEERRK